MRSDNDDKSDSDSDSDSDGAALSCNDMCERSRNTNSVTSGH